MGGIALPFTATPGPWIDNPDRACLGLDTEAWFPEFGAAGQKTAKRAKRICATCPVHDDCLEYALTARPWVFGIWGGTTELERKEMREQREMERAE